MTGQEQQPQEFSGRVAKGKDWREIVAWVGDLPPMPHVASRAIQLVEDPNVTGPDLTNLLSTDTALAARVLKIANSAMFSRQREITTLNQAVMIIGFKALKGIIVAATLRQINKGSDKRQQLIWENSIGTATIATSLARKLRKPYVDEIFLLGLLHSLGQIVLMSNKETAADYNKVFDAVKSQGIEYAPAESEALGFAHPLIGALVAKKWNFSAETCQVILHYKDPIEGPPANEQDEKTYVVQIADLLCHQAGVGSPEGYPKFLELATKLSALIGLDPKNAPAILEEIMEQAVEQINAEKNIYD
jgi:HD-like signal output (HDOD) protein